MSSPPCTQINYLKISKSTTIEQIESEAGRLWSEAQDILGNYDGFIRSYWGRSPEDETKVQLHVVRDYLSQHYDFGKTPENKQLQAIFKKLADPSSTPFTRHAYIEEFTPDNKALGKGAPFTGTAVYLSTDEAWHVGAWPLWTHIVRHVDGCLGVTGGKVVESVDGHHSCYVVYVGWESIEKHDAYHHTKHFWDRRVVLALGINGWKEYGHVAFQGAREAKGRVKKETARTARQMRL